MSEQQDSSVERLVRSSLITEDALGRKFSSPSPIARCSGSAGAPIERDLPMDPRTGDSVRINGRSYRRPELGPEWVLEQFPAPLDG